MRNTRKLIKVIAKEVFRSSITLSLLLSGIVLSTKNKEIMIDLPQIQNQNSITIDVVTQEEEEEEKISITKLDIPYSQASLVEAEPILEPEKIKRFSEQPEITEYILHSKAEKTEKTDETEVQQYVTEPYLIECTAYIPSGNPCRDGTYPVEGITLAGRESWLGRHCNLYYCNDGEIGEIIGTFTFHDTGFGHDPDGDGIGSIETGERIDLFMESYKRAMDWGIKYVYIEFLD